MPRLKFSLPTLTLLAAFGGSAFGQPVPATPNTPTSDGGVGYRAKEVLGTAVNIQGNRGIGTVDDIVFDSAGRIDYLIVANQGRLVSVPWRAARYDARQRTAVVDITQERFQSVPTYSAERYPDFYTPTYRTDLYRAYGLDPDRDRRLTPGQDRRLDRREDRRDDRRDNRPAAPRP